MRMRNARTTSRRIAAGTLTAVLVTGAATMAEAHPGVSKWWQFNKVTWTKSWRDFPRYRREYRRWRTRHQYASTNQARDEQQYILAQYRHDNFHRAISYPDGQASWD